MLSLQMIAADHDWNSSVLRNSSRMELSDERKELFISSNMSEYPHSVVTIFQKWEN